MQAYFESLFWNVPENLCEFWQGAWLIGDGIVEKDICSTSHDLVFQASQM